MALFQPTNILPDVRNGLGAGVVDRDQGLHVFGQINGNSALQSFAITIYTNDAASTQVFTTGQITTGCPAYGTTSAGEIQMFSYTIPAPVLVSFGITNGNEYKMIIKQWWSASDSVTQTSASVFITRKTPTLSIAAIGTGGVISTRYYTFTGNYSQAQGDVLNWFRWQIAYADDTDAPFFDSSNISGTMDISCYYDGFFDAANYAIRLTCQTESGAEADTGWVNFSASYSTPTITGGITAGCVGGTDAVLVKWDGIGYIPGVASGSYTILPNGVITLLAGTAVTWNQVGSAAMSFGTPWSIVLKSKLGSSNATLFTIGQSSGDITLNYIYSTGTLALAKGGTTLVSQSGVINAPTVTAILTPTNLYLRVSYLGGGLYPTTTLYPTATLYPKGDTATITNTYTLTPSYTQTAITSVQISGPQRNDFIEVIDGAASAATITAAITNDSYTPGLADGDYMLADWNNNSIDAGTLNIGGDTLQGFALYRRQGADAVLVKVAETDALTDAVYDYGAASQQGLYTYYLFPVGTSTYISTPFVSGGVNPCWWNWTLMECEETDDNNIFNVLAAYRFKYNVASGSVANNNAPNVLQNFTQYPTIQLAPQNYKSGTLTALIGAIDWSGSQPEYIDTLEIRDALYALSTSQNALFLKNRKGELLRIRISGAVSMQTGDATKEQTQTMTLPWVEVGDASGVSLYSTVYAGAQEPEGESNAQYYVDTSDATADAADILLNKTAYGANGKITGDSAFTIKGTTLVAPPNLTT